jgi:hypothetical protein
MKTKVFGVALLAAAAATAPGAVRGDSGAIESKDGQVTAARPSGLGWECLQQEASEPIPVTLVKCRRTVAGEFFFMLAKVYEVPADQVVPAHDLVTRVYPKDYAKLFDRHTVRGTTKVTHQKNKGLEIRVDAHHKERGDITKVERVFTKGQRVFLVSAEGAPAQFTAHKADIAAWFKSAHFKALD